jgi:hypothetical protein
VFAALITLWMPWVLGRFQAESIFSFFTLMMIGQLLWVLLVMPETRGRSLESLAGQLSRR